MFLENHLCGALRSGTRMSPSLAALFILMVHVMLAIAKTRIISVITTAIDVTAILVTW